MNSTDMWQDNILRYQNKAAMLVSTIVIHSTNTQNKKECMEKKSSIYEDTLQTLLMKLRARQKGSVERSITLIMKNLSSNWLSVIPCKI